MSIQRYVAVVLASILIIQIGILGVVANPVFAANDSLKSVDEQGVRLRNDINLSKSAGASLGPQMVASGNSLFVIWDDDTGSKPDRPDIFFRASTDNGKSFERKMNLSKTPKFSSRADLAASGSNIYVVWAEESKDSGIFFRASPDNGATFGAPINLANDTITNFLQIAASGNNVYVVWDTIDDNIFLRISNDNGTSFGETMNLSGPKSTAPRITSVGNNVYVTWETFDDLDNGEIMFRASNDNGTSFNEAINLSNNTSYSVAQHIAAFGNDVYVIWQDSDDSNSDILFRRSSDNGVSFGETINLSKNSANSISAQIVVSKGYVHVVWEDATIDTDKNLFANVIRYKVSNNNGTSFKDTLRVSGKSTSAYLPVIAASASNAYLVWTNVTPVEVGVWKSEIFLREIKDDGFRLGRVINLSNGSIWSINPQIALTGTNLYIVWQSFDPDNNNVQDPSDIIFARGILRHQCDDFVRIL